MNRLRRNQYDDKNDRKKERVIMLASAVLVLAAMTATGIYVRQSMNTERDDGYTVDFETLEEEEKAKAEAAKEAEAKEAAAKEATARGKAAKEAEAKEASGKAEKVNMDSDLDYDPSATESPLESAVKPVQEENERLTKDRDLDAKEAIDLKSLEDTASDLSAQDSTTKNGAEAGEEATQTSANVAPTLSFSDQSSLMWPVVGDVLIPYSMDKSVYFATLGQYKYSPALVIGAATGTAIYAPANAQITNITYSAVNGNMVEMDLGNGYTMTLGQLEDISVTKGGYVFTGDPIGKVAAPTKYYSVEGSNLYLKMTLQQAAVNPMDWLG